jgi:hypothetical protein
MHIPVCLSGHVRSSLDHLRVQFINLLWCWYRWLRMLALLSSLSFPITVQNATFNAVRFVFAWFSWFFSFAGHCHLPSHCIYDHPKATATIFMIIQMPSAASGYCDLSGSPQALKCISMTNTQPAHAWSNHQVGASPILCSSWMTILVKHNHNLIYIIVSADLSDPWNSLFLADQSWRPTMCLGHRQLQN